MKISSIPANFECAFSDLTYKITEVDPQQSVEVTVLGQSAADVLGVKHFCGQSEYSVNISGYMQRQMDVVPYYRTASGFNFTAGRTAIGRIAVGNTTTDQRVFSAGVKTKIAAEMLSDAPVDQSIAVNEIDEYSFFGENAYIVGYYFYLTKGTGIRELAYGNLGRGNNQMIYYTHAMNDVVKWAAKSSTLKSVEAYDHLEVWMEARSKLTLVRRYAIRPVSDKSVRLCWVNPYGAIDYYTFTRQDGERIVTNRRQIYNTEGYRTYDAATQRFKTLRSEYVNAETVSWLASIMAAPRVWIAEGAVFTPVDVAGGEVVVSEGAPSYFTLAIRERKKLAYQNF